MSKIGPRAVRVIFLLLRLYIYSCKQVLRLYSYTMPVIYTMVCEFHLSSFIISGELQLAYVTNIKAHPWLINVDPSAALFMPGVVGYIADLMSLCLLFQESSSWRL